MKNKRFLVSVLVFALVFSVLTSSGFSALTQEEKKVQIKENVSSALFNSEMNERALEKKFGISSKKLLENKGKSAIHADLVLGEIADNTISCVMDGKIAINNRDAKFKTEGLLNIIKVSNGNTLYVGGLHGYYGNSNEPQNMIDLSIYYNVDLQKTYILANIGAYQDDNNVPVQLEYGEFYDGISEASKTLAEGIKAAEQQPVYEDMGLMAVGVRDTAMRKTANGSYNGYTVVYASLWGQTGVPQNSSYKYYLKVQTNKSNFIKGANKGLYYDPNDPLKFYTTIDHAVVDYWTVARTSTTSLDFNGGALPEEQSQSVSIPITIPFSTTLDYLASFINLSIPIRGVDHTYSNSNTKLETHVWGTNITGMFTTLASPYTEKTGCATTFQIYNHFAPSRSGTLYGYGAVRYFYLAVRGNGETVSKWATASTYEMSQTLTSVNN